MTTEYKKLNLGIVGTGMIAEVVAAATLRADQMYLAGVSSRKLPSAKTFQEKIGADFLTFEGWKSMLDSDAIDAVYIATPTSVKEEIALAAISAGKHVLVDKPIHSFESAKKMVEAAEAKDVAIMDATHFSNHPRTSMIRAQDEAGEIHAIRSAFYFPFEDRSNIRFLPDSEPTGGVGDLAWYNMRAIVEFMDKGAEVKSATAFFKRDPQTNGVIQANGVIAFKDGKVSTFDVGYTSGAIAMDLDLYGDKGILSLDDFVLDWHNSFAYDNEDLPARYRVRQELQPTPLTNLVNVPFEKSQTVAMVDNFANIIKNKSERGEYAHKLLRTQQLVDIIWEAGLKNEA